MRAGELRHVVTLQAITRTKDAGGGYVETPQTVTTLRALIQPAAASQIERSFSGAVVATATHLVRIRYYPGITTKMQLAFGSRTFRICGLRNVDERNRQIDMACQEILS